MLGVWGYILMGSITLETPLWTVAPQGEHMCHPPKGAPQTVVTVGHTNGSHLRSPT